MALHVRVGDSRVRVVFSVARSRAVPVLQGISFIDKSAKGIFSSERMVVVYNSKQVPILALNDLAGKYKDEDNRA